MSELSVSKEFVLAGRAIFTIELNAEYAAKVNLKPHYTFSVRHKKAHGSFPEKWFVKLRTGRETSDYSYLGVINPSNGSIRTTDKSFLKSDHLILKLFNRTMELVWQNDISVMLEKGFNLHHEGRCGRCGRSLTTPASISSGFGPDCLKAIGGAFPNISTPGHFVDLTTKV